MKTMVILNEQHKILEDQARVLNEKFGEGNWEIYPVPEQGWTLEEMEKNIIQDIYSKGDIVVFASPVPVLIMNLSYCEGQGAPVGVFVLHNDHREKKELPNGKIISIVAQTGWQIVTI